VSPLRAVGRGGERDLVGVARLGDTAGPVEQLGTNGREPVPARQLRLVGDPGDRRKAGVGAITLGDRD
jgi:hypothetical protein